MNPKLHAVMGLLDLLYSVKIISDPVWLEAHHNKWNLLAFYLNRKY